MKADKNRKIKLDKKYQRISAIEAGYYDGRFKTKIIPDKDKEREKYLCRQKIVF